MPKRHAVRRSQQSAVARIEEIVLASSGADSFELVFSLVAARLARGAGDGPAYGGRSAIARGVKEAARRWPGLGASSALDVPDEVLAKVGSLLDRAGVGSAGDAEGLDAVFEQLVARVGKGEKGQFFTPRHVVDWIARMLLLQPGEKVIDPACGSGAFLVHARAQAAVETWGFDVDARAVRVARLIAAASGDDPARIVRADSLSRGRDGGAGAAAGSAIEGDVVMTNPPFAGDVEYDGYELAKLGRRAERDTLFVERCIEMLRPGGRLAIVLPHNKVAASASSGLRRWLSERARVYAVVSLARETFLPHTSQKAVVVFARRRAEPIAFAELDGAERVLFAASVRGGKDAGGETIFRTGTAGAGWRAIDHDLDAIGPPLIAFLQTEGFAHAPLAAGRRTRDRNHAYPANGAPALVIQGLAELGPGVTFAPERHLATRLLGGDGVPLSSLVAERAERVVPGELEGSVVFDTTHAREGLLDVRAALRASEAPSSAKKLVRPGDLLVSRLRPYLRQIAFVHPALIEECAGRAMACSTEFYVLSPTTTGESLAFLLPWLLGADAQAVLAAAQEGGHHPRVPRETLLALRIPIARIRARRAVSGRVERGIADFLIARTSLTRLMEE
jgi:type I restriction enzyme M protein